MTWNQAEQLLAKHIQEGLELEPNKANKREIKSADADGFKVKIGQTTAIDVPMTMLQNIFDDTILNNGIYNKDVFRMHYPTQAEQSSGHPCYVHVVGKIFEIAGIATRDGRDYQLL